MCVHYIILGYRDVDVCMSMWARSKWTDSNRVGRFIDLLNEIYGWELVGGNRSKEFSITSNVSGGRFYFDGFDRKRLIFFEFDDLSHTYNSYVKHKDEKKLIALKEEVKRSNVSATLIRFDEVTSKLKIIDL